MFTRKIPTVQELEDLATGMKPIEDEYYGALNRYKKKFSPTFLECIKEQLQAEIENCDRLARENSPELEHAQKSTSKLAESYSNFLESKEKVEIMIKKGDLDLDAVEEKMHDAIENFNKIAIEKGGKKYTKAYPTGLFPNFEINRPKKGTTKAWMEKYLHDHAIKTKNTVDAQMKYKREQ